MSAEVYLTKKEVALQVGRSKEWVEKHSKFDSPLSPVLPAVKVLGRYRWRQTDVDAFIAANTQTKD